MKPICQENAAFDLAAVRERLKSARGPRYWRSLDEVARTREFVAFLSREFPSQASEWLNGLSRRQFLRMMGASLALAGLTSCTRQPPERIVPYIQQPEAIVPGKPLFFATAMPLGGFATGLLVESHEGHPTKIEGNPDHPMSLGASNVFQQASLLDLYDPDRSQAVLNQGKISTWGAFLSALEDALAPAPRKNGAGLRILTETVTSPTLHTQIEAVLQKFPEARWHQFEPVNRDNVRAGALLAFGEVVEAQHHFEKARVLLAIDSDCLFAHPASLRYTRDYTDRRRVSAGRKEMNRLYVVESTPSVTGSNADHRLAITGPDIEDLVRAVARQLGAITDAAVRLSPARAEWIDALVTDLQQNRRQSIVIVGKSQPPTVHALAHALNQVLGNVGETLHYTETAVAQPTDQLESLRALGEDLSSGVVHTLIILGGNPAYDAPADFGFARQLSQAKLSIHLSPELNETSTLCHWHIPQSHYLEAWSDARAYDGTISIIQPVIIPLYAGKSAHEVLDALLSQPVRSDYDIVHDHWRGRKRLASGAA